MLAFPQNDEDFDAELALAIQASLNFSAQDPTVHGGRKEHVAVVDDYLKALDEREKIKEQSIKQKIEKSYDLVKADE
jgi:hypothetical protein